MVPFLEVPIAPRPSSLFAGHFLVGCFQVRAGKHDAWPFFPNLQS